MRMDFMWAASDFRMSGSIAHWAQAPKARVALESSQIELAAFSPFTRGPSAPLTGLPARPGGRTYGGRVCVCRPCLLQEIFRDRFPGHVLWDHGMLTVERISGDTNDGHVAGQVKIREAGRRIRQARSTSARAAFLIEQALSLVQEKPFVGAGSRPQENWRPSGRAGSPRWRSPASDRFRSRRGRKNL